MMSHKSQCAGGLAAVPPDDRIGVLFFTSAPYLGGAVFGMRSIARLLDRSRFRAVISFSEDAAQLIHFFRGEDVEIVPIRTRALARWSPAAVLDLARSVRELARVCRERRIHIFYSNSPRALVLGPLLRPVAGVKFVWNIAMLGQPWYSHLLAHLPDVATCVSHAVHREFGARKNMRVIYVGAFAENLSLEQARARRHELRAELGISEQTLVVGCVANLQYWKGIHVLLDALAIASRALPEILLVHLGGPVPGYEQYAKQIEAQIADLGLAPRILRLGFRADAYRYYPFFDLLVHTPVPERFGGASEAFGSPVAEAMGYRLPVIASRLGGPAEIVEEGVTGELIEPGNAGELAEKILQLLRDPARRLRMGAAGFARYQEHFTIEREVREYERLYLELLRPNDARHPTTPPPPPAADAPHGRGDFRYHWQQLDADARFPEKMRLAELEQRPFVALLEKLLAESPPAPRVLEVGAGSAAASRLLAQRIAGSVVAFDLLPQAMRVARRLAPAELNGRLVLVAADVFHAPFAEDSFDLVFSQGLVEHFPDPRAILAAHARLVRPGGWLVINVPQALNPYTLYKHWKMRRGAWPPGWETQFSPPALARVAGPLGFDIVALDGHGSFLRMMAARALRPVLPVAAQAALVRLADAADRLLGARLRAWTSMNVIGCFRRPPAPARAARSAAA
jgi:glycosyltransferase involved in cell wall biosynthesis/SAM-dependent methyltransferase